MERVVIIEGNPLFQQALKTAFHSRFPSMEVIAEADRDKAIELIGTFHPDIILIDLKPRRRRPRAHPKNKEPTSERHRHHSQQS